MQSRKVVCLLLATALLLYLGCINGDSVGSKGVGLYRCKDCNELEQFVKAVAIEAMERELWRNFSEGIYYEEGDDDWVDDDDGDDGGDDGDDGDDSGDGDGESDYSETNVQEEGVDEADLIKTDGEYLYYLVGDYSAGDRLLVFDISPADQTKKIAELKVGYDDWFANQKGLFLYKNWLLVIVEEDPYSLPSYVWPDVDRSELYYYILKLLIVDISNPSSPSVVREFYAEGDYINARRIDQSARIVIYTYPKGPYLQTWIDPYEYFDDGVINYDALKEAYQELEERNNDIINNTPLEEFLPRYYDIVHTPEGDIIRSGILSECEDFYLPEEPIGRGILSVITINLDEPTEKKTDIAVVADGMLVYASKDNLFVTADFMDVQDWADPEKSQIHMFDIHSDANEAIYLASGLIDGWVLNQFSMSEYEGFLRVATTKWQIEEAGEWGESVSQVLVLKNDDGVLEIVGRLDNIAPGERIYAVRFLGERGFIVTFVQIDPLFTIDLSDPYNPKLVGELKIPGFSNYIHPMGETHLLTVGVNGNDEGWTWGVALNIFDVSDFANPKLLHQEEVGGYYSYSPAQSDHHAFLYFKEFLSIPLLSNYYWYDDEENFCGFYLYRATAKDGFKKLTTIDHGDTYYNEPTRSSIIKGFLYTLSRNRLIVTNLSNLENIKNIGF